jgi:uncharacterized protein
VRKLLILGLFGLIAQLVDGTLSIAYGVTTTTLLLTAGAAPAIASATVHLAEVGTTLASGTAHWRFGNVDWRTVGLMAFPGAVAAFIGAVILSSLSAEVAEPWVAAILFALGVYILWRFSHRRQPVQPKGEPKGFRAVFLSPLGAFAGLIDAMGGGGWGPIGTSSLLASGRLEPRKVVGSIDTSEFLVTLGASAGFLVALSFAQINIGSNKMPTGHVGGKPQTEGSPFSSSRRTSSRASLTAPGATSLLSATRSTTSCASCRSCSARSLPAAPTLIPK